MSVRITCGKGVNKDVLPSELEPGYWSDMLNFRSRNGLDEKFEGVVSSNTGATISAAVGDKVFFLTLGSEGAIYSNGTKAYVLIGSTHYEITRYRKSETISSLNRIAANTAEVTTASAHGLTTGDTIDLFGAVETGYNTTSAAAITVMSATVFRYTTPSAIAANATTVGKYVVHTSSATSDFVPTNLSDVQTGGTLNGTPFFGAYLDGIYYWQVDGAATHKLRRVPFSVPNALVVRTFKDYLVALTLKNVYWSDAAEAGTIPTTMTAGAANDAGLVPMAETPGVLRDCLPLGDVNIVYKSDSMYAMQYVGGNSVFRFTRLPGEDGLFRAGCVVNTPKGHVFLTQSLDIKIHQGGFAKSIADGRVRKYFASAISTGTFTPFLCTNPEKSEVWVCFNTSGTRFCDKALVWNWESDTWGIFSLDSPIGSTGNGVIAATTGSWPTTITSKDRLVLLNADFDFLLVDSSATSVLTGTLERTGLDLGDRDQMKTIHRSRWNFDGTAGNSVTVNHGASQTADGTTSWSSNISYTLGTTDMGNGRSTYGRFVGVKLSTTVNSISLRSYDLDVKTGGTR